MSVNVGPYDTGNHVCQLNNATDESPTLSHLSNRKSYTYHGIEVRVYDCSNSGAPAEPHTHIGKKRKPMN